MRMNNIFLEIEFNKEGIFKISNMSLDDLYWVLRISLFCELVLVCECEILK